MKRTLNFKFLGLLLAVVAILTIAGHFAHGIQLKRKSSYLLDQSNRAVNDKDFPKLLGYVSHYLSFHPEDGRARARYGVLLARKARSRNEFEFAYVTLERARDAPNLEQTLRDDPALQELKNNADPEIAKIANDEINLRRRIAEIALEMHQFANAIVHLEAALKDNPKDAELLTLMGMCEEALGKSELAVKAYQAAIEAKRGHIEGYIRLAYLLRETKKQPKPIR